MDTNVNFASPLMSKDAVRYITQSITPEQVAYVADIKNVYDECEDCGIEDPKKTEWIVFVTKIMAFADKFRVLHWAATNMSFHKAMDEFCDEMEKFKDSVAENIQGVTGQFKDFEFTHIDLPVGDNPLVVINELKICVNNFMEFLNTNTEKEAIEFEGIKNIVAGFLETIHKYVYLFRLCKEN